MNGITIQKIALKHKPGNTGKLDDMNTRRTLSTALILCIVLSACGSFNFANELKVVLAASTPLIDSLNLGDKRAALIQDFADLADGAADLADDLKTCAKDKPCSLTAIDKFTIRFWDVERRGHFKLSPKLEKIQTILAAIIASAKIYFAPPAAGRQVGNVSEASIRAQIAELKIAMSGK